MSKFIKVTIVILLLIFFFNAGRTDLDFFSHLLLSNQKYQKHIIVRSAVVTKDEVKDFFDSVSLPVQQKANRDLYDKELFLVVQYKNSGIYRGFGKMQFKIYGPNLLIPVNCAKFLGNTENFYNNCAVIYLGKGIVPNNEDCIKITYYWENLYTL